MNRSETIGKLATALAKAQGEMDNADKDSRNDHYKSSYADLAAVRAAIRGPLSKHGLAYVQLPRFNGEMVEVETILMHGETGEFISETMSIPLFKRDAHSIGSACTYARRFSLMAVLGIAPDEDDDGNAASERPAPTRPAVKNYKHLHKDGAHPWRGEPAAPAQPIDEIPHEHPKEAPAEAGPSTPAPTEAAASVMAARPDARVAQQEEPAAHNSQGAGSSPASRTNDIPSIKSNRGKQPDQAKINGSLEVRNRLKFHLDKIDPSQRDARKQINDWLKLAAAAKLSMTTEDQKGITADYNAKISDIVKAERMRIEENPPRAEQQYDPDTGELEAAE